MNTIKLNIHFGLRLFLIGLFVCISGSCQNKQSPTNQSNTNINQTNTNSNQNKQSPTTQSNTGSNQNEQLPTIQPNTDSNQKETRLGESNYYIQLPDSFKLSEAGGKEGQLGYNIEPKNTSSTMLGFIEIKHGSPIGETFSESKKGQVFAKSNLLDKEISWTLNKTETGYFEAFTTEKGDINAQVSSNNRKEINLLIAIIATLKQK